MAKPNKPEENRQPNGTFGPGNNANPAGRPKGKTMKEFAREVFITMSDDEKKNWLKGLSPDLIWRMAEGNPAQDVTSGGEKINPIPIYGGLSVQSLPTDDSDGQDIQPKKAD